MRLFSNFTLTRCRENNINRSPIHFFFTVRKGNQQKKYDKGPILIKHTKSTLKVLNFRNRFHRHFIHLCRGGRRKTYIVEGSKVRVVSEEKKSNVHFFFLFHFLRLAFNQILSLDYFVLIRRVENPSREKETF